MFLYVINYHQIIETSGILNGKHRIAEQRVYLTSTDIKKTLTQKETKDKKTYVQILVS